MIEPVRSGRALLHEIASTLPEAGSVAVWWLGQSGFLLKSSEVMLVVDPYLSEHLTKKYAVTDRPHVRMSRAPFRGADLTGVDLVLASHKHSDHLDPGTIPDLLAANPAATLVIPAAIEAHAIEIGVGPGRIEGLDGGETLVRPGVTVLAIPSAHEGLDTDGLGRNLYLGFVIETGGLRFYHSGDTLAYDGLSGELKRSVDGFDVMFLPINGRDPARGVAGNMDAAGAVALANRVKPRFVVPHHYDMFTFNTAPVSGFEREARNLAPGTAAKVLRCGERWEVRR